MSHHQIGLIIGAVVAFLVALFIAPLFPPPLSTIVMWLGYIAAAICVILFILTFVRGGTYGRRA